MLYYTSALLVAYALNYMYVEKKIILAHALLSENIFALFN